MLPHPGGCGLTFSRAGLPAARRQQKGFSAAGKMAGMGRQQTFQRREANVRFRPAEDISGGPRLISWHLNRWNKLKLSTAVHSLR
jgi:hypothetical protein